MSLYPSLEDMKVDQMAKVYLRRLFNDNKPNYLCSLLGILEFLKCLQQFLNVMLLFYLGSSCRSPTTAASGFTCTLN